MPKNPSKHSIFRGKALQTYIQNQEKSVLPRVVAPPVFLLCWLLLMILLVSGFIAWLGRVPVYVAGSGMIPASPMLSAQGSDEAVAFIPLPMTETAYVHAGFPAHIQIGQSGPQLNCLVTDVSPAVLSPSEIQQQYGLIVTDPSKVIAIRLGSTISRRVYAGSLVHVQIQVGSQRLLALFPVFNSVLKD